MVVPLYAITFFGLVELPVPPSSFSLRLMLEVNDMIVRRVNGVSESKVLAGVGRGASGCQHDQK